MENDKATAWLTLADADAVEDKVIDVLNKLFGDGVGSNSNVDGLAQRIAHSFVIQNTIAGYLRPQIQGMIKDAVTQNFKIDHYYESWNRTAGYRIRYGDHVIQTEQIKIGF